MEQLDMLWEYQKLELLMEQYEDERKNSPLRHKLLKLQNYLVQQQNELINLNGETEKKSNFYNRINHEYENVTNLVKSTNERIENGELKNVKQLEHIEKELIAAKDKIDRKDQELSALLDELNNISTELNKIGLGIANGKKEYTIAKTQYDEEMGKYKLKHDKFIETKSQLKNSIDKSLLNKYESIKLGKSAPVAVINDERCGGCNMSLASLVIQNVIEKKHIVECENCGRILYVESSSDAS